MDRPRRDAIALQREIATTRNDLVTHVEHLRGAIRRRLSLRAQLRAHPAVAFGIALVLSLPLLVLVAAARARAVK